MLVLCPGIKRSHGGAPFGKRTHSRGGKEVLKQDVDRELEKDQDVTVVTLNKGQRVGVQDGQRERRLLRVRRFTAKDDNVIKT
jgi:hypothetical protein